MAKHRGYVEGDLVRILRPAQYIVFRVSRVDDDGTAWGQNAEDIWDNRIFSAYPGKGKILTEEP